MRKLDFVGAMTGLLFDIQRKLNNKHDPKFLIKWIIKRLERIEKQVSNYEKFSKKDTKW